MKRTALIVATLLLVIFMVAVFTFTTAGISENEFVIEDQDSRIVLEESEKLDWKQGVAEFVDNNESLSDSVAVKNYNGYYDGNKFEDNRSTTPRKNSSYNLTLEDRVSVESKSHLEQSITIKSHGVIDYINVDGETVPNVGYKQTLVFENLTVGTQPFRVVEDSETVRYDNLTIRKPYSFKSSNRELIISFSDPVDYVQVQSGVNETVYRNKTLQLSQGVYTVQIVGDSHSRTETVTVGKE